MGYHRSLRGSSRSTFIGKGRGRRGNPSPFYLKHNIPGKVVQKNLISLDGRFSTCIVCGSIYHWHKKKEISIKNTVKFLVTKKSSYFHGQNNIAFPMESI